MNIFQFIKVIVLFLVYINCNIGYCLEIVNLRSFGAKGDGISNDSKSLLKAFSYSNNKDVVIDGEGLSYVIFGNIRSVPKSLSLKNLKIITGCSQIEQASFKIISDKIELSNIEIFGDRNNLKKEEWTIFGEENGVSSIFPSVKEVFKLEALNSNSTIKINNLNAKDIHSQCIILIRSLGIVEMANIRFNNLSNKGFHVYHVNYDDSQKGGSTFVNEITTGNTGILPAFIYVNGVKVSSSIGKYMPQESFNCIVTFGNYKISNAFITNYGSTGITSDRNLYFVGENLSIICNSEKAMSNNPSAGLWLESSKSVKLKKVSIDIIRRHARDLLFDNSALHIFGENSSVNVIGLNITTGNDIVLNKGIRGSLSLNNEIKLDSINVKGRFKQGGIFLAGMQDISNSNININNISLQNCNLFFWQVKKAQISNLSRSVGSESISYLLSNNDGALRILNSNVGLLKLSPGFKNFEIKSKEKMRNLVIQNH